MAADKILEALARIEHKLDLLIEVSGLKEPTRVGEDRHHCPLCKQKVEYHPNVTDGVVLRKCGCKTGKIALDMKAFAPPVFPARKNQDDTGEDDNADRPNQSSRSRRNSKR